MSSIKNVIYVTIIIFLIMTFVMNKNVREKINEILNKKFLKFNIIVKDVILALIIVVIVLYMFRLIIKIKDNIKFYLIPNMEQDKILIENGKKITEQSKKYKEIMNMETNIDNCKNPYIPDGFTFIDGEWNTGFVIEDENKNQFVWIPCTNIKNDENIPILKKKNFLPNVFISYFSCYESDENYEDFMESALEYGGFYVSRYEIGIENEKPVSKSGSMIWTDILYNEAKENSNNMYQNINSALINGYAYDTMLSFVYNEIKNEQTSIKGNETTGTKSYKNIYDILDDNCEWTSEFYFDSVIYRGSYESNKIMDISPLDNRFCSNIDFISPKIGFRMIIYK